MKVKLFTILFPSSSFFPFLLYFVLLKSILSALKESKCSNPLSKSPFVSLSSFVSARVDIWWRQEAERKRVIYVRKCQKLSKYLLIHMTPFKIREEGKKLSQQYIVTLNTLCLAGNCKCCTMDRLLSVPWVERLERTRKRRTYQRHYKNTKKGSDWVYMLAGVSLEWIKDRMCRKVSLEGK